MRSLGSRLARRLRARFRQPANPAAQDRLPVTPDIDGLADAVAAAQGGGDATDVLAGLLLATARSGDPVLIGAAEQLLADADTRLWSMLDITTRRNWWHSPSWTTVAVDRFLSVDPQPVECVLAACHPNGYVREAAVALMADTPRKVYASILAIRAADCVPQVRDRARIACQRWLDDAPIDALLALGPMAFAAEQRQAGQWLAGSMLTLLREGPRDVLAAGLAAADRRVRRAAYRMGLEAGRLDVGQILRGALADHDLVIRLACADAARHAVARGDHAVLRRLLRSKTARIRADAVNALALTGDLDPSTAALLDRSPLVRATAQAIARRTGMDAAAHYGAVLGAQRPPNPAALAGLGETGAADDQDLLLPWLAHPLSRGRVETIRALRRLGTERAVPAMMLTDPAPAVVRQVAVSLRSEAATLDEQVLHTYLTPSQPRYVRLAAWRLLRDRDTWSRLMVDLQLINDLDTRIRNSARTDISSWLATDAAAKK